MKRLLVEILCITVLCVGCSAPSETKVEPIAETKMEPIAETKVEPIVETKVDADMQETMLRFEELSNLQFEFCSGAGGWTDRFVIEKDGSFTGRYTDSEMGDVGEGYENGSFYCSNYSGHFTNLEKVDEYTYKMTLSEISYKEEEGKEEILDGIRYVYTKAYALGGNDTFYVYLPGTPIRRFSEEVWIWIQYANESEDVLTQTVIVDEENLYGIYSYERRTPVEDAQMTYDSYKESYDNYYKKASELITTLELKENAMQMYEAADDCLNYLWNMIRSNVDGEAYEQILSEQRQWVAEKEAAAESAVAEWEGGSFAPVISLDTQAEMTMKRCEELLEYIKQNIE